MSIADWSVENMTSHMTLRCSLLIGLLKIWPLSHDPIQDIIGW